MWDQVNGVRSMVSVLQTAGVDLTGWSLASANAVTPDGKIVVGTGYNPSGNIEAWLARLP
jgi:hypothetical protein